MCGTPCQVAIDLPALPLTDSYGSKPAHAPEAGIDQQLMLCPRCGHGRLATLLSPDLLYSGDYSFRTSTSHTSSAGSEVFLALVEKLTVGRELRCVLDVGCNDLYLLGRLQGHARHRVGIDPVWAGREAENTDQGIVVSGATFEAADLDVLLPEPADLIVARHTLEHIHGPLETIRKMLACAKDDAIIMIEVPGFDTLVKRQRYDNVFHQHIQYFSRSSLSRLAAETGTEVLAMTENYHHWGAILVALQRLRGASRSALDVNPRMDRIIDGYRVFRRELEGVVPLVESLGGRLYGYGAAQMLPILGYHMHTDFSFLEAILDDDRSKDGLGYWNLPVKVEARREATDLSEATVLITAVDSTAPIMRRLLERRPRHVVTPFRII